MQITGPNTSSSFLWTLFVESKTTYFLGPWALLSYADLTKHPSGPTPFPTNAPREKRMAVSILLAVPSWSAEEVHGKVFHGCGTE